PTEIIQMQLTNVGDRVMVDQSNNGGAASLYFKTSATANDFMVVEKNGAFATGTIAGINLANLSRIGTAASAGPLMIHVMNNNPMYFTTNNTERMRILADGRVFINQTAATGFANTPVVEVSADATRKVAIAGIGPSSAGVSIGIYGYTPAGSTSA